MSEPLAVEQLSLLQQVGIATGIGGFIISLVNAAQIWARNRPVMSVHPGDDNEIEVTIQNPSARSITIGRTICRPGAHSLEPEDANVRHAVRRAVEGGGVNWIIPAGKDCRFTFFHAANARQSPESWFFLIITWYSNSAFLFSRVPLFVFMTKRKRSRLRASGVANA